MTTKEWLNRGRDLDKEINALEQARYSAYCACVSRTSRSKQDIIMTDKNPNEKLERLAEINRQIDVKIDELTEIKNEILCIVRMIEDEKCKSLLTERYVRMKTWEQISETLGLDASTVRGRLHATAINLCATYCAFGRKD